MHRREWLLTLLTTPLAVRGLEGAAYADDGQNAEMELVVCGWDEVFILAIGGGASPSQRKVWSWRAADSPEIPEALRAAFRTTDDCKPVDGGRRILLSSSGGAIALVDRESRRALFHARVVNAHSIEMLPDYRVAAAASVSNTSAGNRIVIFDAQTGAELVSDLLRSAHGVVWDEARRVLWALGGDVLRSYSVGAPGAPARLERTFEIALPAGGGHDLVAVPGSPLLFVSTVRSVWSFDRNRNQFTPHDTLADQANIKSYSIHRPTGRVVYIQAEGQDWWAEHLHFQRPNGAVRLAGEHLYKARWM